MAQCTSEENMHSSKTATDWDQVSELMNRSTPACQAKWKKLHPTELKKGPFTAEEDAIIRRRKVAWKDKGNGLWTSLGKELGRSGTSIARRWTCRLDPDLHRVKHGAWSKSEVNL